MTGKRLVRGLVVCAAVILLLVCRWPPPAVNEAFASAPAMIGVVTAIPAIDVTPAGVVTIFDANVMEISGKVSSGTGQLHILRKVILTGGHYQYRPWAEDRPIDPLADTQVGGYFSARYNLPNSGLTEYFVILNPSGTITFDYTTDLVARGVTY